MNLPDFFSVQWILLLTLLFFVIITGRYFLIAGLFYLIFYNWFPTKWENRKLNKKKYKQGQFRKEIKWSLITSLLFSVAGTITVILWQKGYTKVYTEIHQYGWWYLPVSLIVFLFFHETYYYWLHRWMHLPAIFKIVHKVHHDSNIASPFTAFSFHPLEGLLQAVFLPVMLMILPMHYFVIIMILIIMTFSSVVNHLDIELYPAGSKSFIGKWIIGATHHSLHHKQFKYNYGLYFTFWDKLKKTESPAFRDLYNKITGKSE
jgi:sterol desaturase/sphingolipid hydroxylase (fatty acid hydroxylase superfamily)